MKLKLSISFILFVIVATAQEINYKLGKVSEAEILQEEHPIEKEAEAAILYKKERVEYEFTPNKGFKSVRYCHYRIKIYNKDGLDWGTIEVPLYKSNNEEETVYEVKGYSYNLMDGKIEETKLKKDGILKENVNKYRNKVSIVMPAVKEGTVIDVEYKVGSEFIGNLDTFVMQYGIPLDKVEIKVEIPEYFVFKRHGKGYHPINVRQTKENRKIPYSYKSGNDVGFSARNQRSTGYLEFFENKYVIETSNIPSLRNTDYTDNIDNYRSAIKFELASVQFPDSPYKNYSLSWADVAKTIYKSSDFGGELSKKRLFEEVLLNLKGEGKDDNQLMLEIFDYVKNEITWNGYYGYYCENGLKNTLKEKTGNVADINLLLVGLLKEAGFKVDPVLVSTKSNGLPLYPTNDGFNYVIAGLSLDGKLIYLDATEKLNGFGLLPSRAMNWYGRLVKEDLTSKEVSLVPKKLAKEVTFLQAKLSVNGLLEGKIRNQYFDNTALYYRKKYKDSDVVEVMEEMEENNTDFSVDNLKFNNKNKYNKALVKSFEFSKENQLETIGDKLFFKPFFFMGLTQNPFIEESREYPVDFVYPNSKKITVLLDIPEGYTVESVPENVALALPDQMGLFSYTTEFANGKLKCQIQQNINVHMVPAQLYPSLKEFYGTMVQKQLEQVVLVKA
ncbi:hypothetical protein BUL40_04475 [Croceivirga radicis]|uniref:DUF3857 domain-containing protein n=1 Tax=Croceivirga radicis TaxID=1929488 RepID=A0A1V6LUK7_9FLAO|nr:DUF3857 domain-containing protein [Croceivirga radicis]OQD43865.1 hypothetical protein BUL40_04475 [Croceivirga radicis]